MDPGTGCALWTNGGNEVRYEMAGFQFGETR